MSMEFRCEKCDTLLSVDALAGAAIRCPSCRKKIFVPAAIAALPKPLLPTDPPSTQENALIEPSQETESKTILALNSAMPWVISTFFHVGTFLLMLFVAMLVIGDKVPIDTYVPRAPSSLDPNSMMKPGSADSQLQASSPTPTKSKSFSRKAGIVSNSDSIADVPLDLIGIGGGTPSGDLGCDLLNIGGPHVGPNFCGTGYEGGGNCNEIVYVIDSSGSMINTFDFVKMEMVKSIGRLRKQQSFHVIFYASGKPNENFPRRLVAANKQNRIQAANFIKDVTAYSQTNPVPALKRAFEVLKRGKKGGKLIFLLADGQFPNNENVLQTIRAYNIGTSPAMINTILYGDRPAEAVEVMKEIAAQTGGTYKFVSADE